MHHALELVEAVLVMCSKEDDVESYLIPNEASFDGQATSQLQGSLEGD